MKEPYRPRQVPMKKKRKIRFDIISIFPDIFDSYFKESLIIRAIRNKIIDIKLHNLRDFSLPSGKSRRTIDDRPFGGGPGMVFMIDPVFKAISKLKNKNKKNRVILFSTRGKKLNAKIARRLSLYDQLIMICGRYEGVDERVAKYIADEEISIGDYILSGGELPAMILVESISRFIPGFLGKHDSLEEIKGSYPVYTQPAEFSPGKGRTKWKVPPVLLSGNHKKIEEWRRKTRS